jgi:ribosomal protein S18 acetylase RimI-like enzyme
MDMSNSTPTIREGKPHEIQALGEAFRQMWIDNAIAPADIEPDYLERVERFVVEGRERAALCFFLAEHAGQVVGAACCQLFEGLYPAILKRELRRYGYIWGVYVAPIERCQGLGRRLTETCVQALVERGCTHALLHAAPPGKGVYEGLGFVSTNEMRLTLKTPTRR